MRRLISSYALFVASLLSSLNAKDGIFYLDTKEPKKVVVVEDELVMRMSLKPFDSQDVAKVILFESEGSVHGEYTIQIDLDSALEKSGPLIVVLGDVTILEGVSIGGAEGFGCQVSFGCDELALARDWLKRLGDLFNLKNESQIDLVRPEKEAEQAVPPKSDRAGG